MLCAIYCRVSTKDQAVHGYSLEAQESLLRQYAADHSVTVYDLYADRGKSANKALNKRTELLRMLRDAESRKFDCILFKDITRWSRNSAQYYAVQDRLDKAGVYWLAVEQPYLETKTPTGRFQVTVMLGTAQLESENTSQRIKFVMANRVMQGGAINGSDKLPLGYRVDDSTGTKKVVKDEQTAPIVMDLFDHYRKNRNQHELCRYIKDQYGITIWQPNLSKLIRNTMYYGEYRGNLNYCEPYLTKSEWTELNMIKPVYSRQTHNHLYLFRGLLRCPECGKVMCARYKQNVNGGRVYYACQYHLEYHTCSYSHQIRQDRIESYLLDAIVPEFAHYTEKPKMKLPKKSNREKQVKSLQAKLERAKNLYIEGDISKDEYSKRRDAIRTELGKLEPDYSELDIKLLEEILNRPWRSMYDKIGPEEKSRFWHTILRYIEIKPDGTYKPWFTG